MEDRSASQQIDDIIKNAGDWRGPRLSRLRTLIKAADPAVVEEVKWKNSGGKSGIRGHQSVDSSGLPGR
jgi:hypothetical protein